MAWDFKPGDEVTLVKPVTYRRPPPRWMFWRRRWLPTNEGPAFGAVYVVAKVQWCPPEYLPHPHLGGRVSLNFREWPGNGYAAALFRKVQRRSISQWLETSTDFEEPKRTPADAQSVQA